VLGNSIALYNPPIRVAEELAMLDVISGGRLIAGFPVGTSMDTNYCYGENPATLRDKYREAHDLIQKAWAEPEPFAWNGKYTKLRYVNIWPKPIQKPRPPIWIPGLGSIETWDFCIDHGYNYSYLSFSGYKRAQKMMSGYWEHVAKRGKPENPHSAAFFQQVCVSDTDAACEKEWGPHVDYFFNKCLHIYPGRAEAPGYRTEASQRASVVAQPGNVSNNYGKDKSWKELVEQRYVVAGSPATVRQQLEELAKTLRVGHLILAGHIGTAPIELTNRSTYLCATQVLPHLRPIHSEWEDVSWPKPLPANQRVQAGQYGAEVKAEVERKAGAAT
jgi:alkanesulfonate monooxygenase SsuD/methylene tetrahydromethanopterin reductase-like flavin-dependent oxidoreductase (luciferase family)